MNLINRYDVDKLREALENLLSTLHHDYCDSSCPVKSAMDKSKEALSAPTPAAEGPLFRWTKCSEKMPPAGMQTVRKDKDNPFTETHRFGANRLERTIRGYPIDLWEWLEQINSEAA